MRFPPLVFLVLPLAAGSIAGNILLALRLRDCERGRRTLQAARLLPAARAFPEQKSMSDLPAPCGGLLPLPFPTPRP